MADISAKLRATLQLVEQGKYFTINRPRQYGKTTTLFLLTNTLAASRNYLTFSLSFAGIGNDVFENEKAFCRKFIKLLASDVKSTDEALASWLLALTDRVNDLEELGEQISELIKKTKKKVVLLIDEVDKSSNNQLFISFLAMLREKFMQKAQGKDDTFHAVVLAGVHDVKTLKLKIRPDAEPKLNSPWNIAVPFEVDMSLQSHEIIPMLEDYMQEREVDMDAPLIAEKLFYYTSGYPFLVSRLCQIIDEKIMSEKPGAAWDGEDVATAVSILVKESNTNFDSLVKNLEDSEELYKLVHDIIIEGQQYEYNIHDPVVYLGFQYGILSNGHGQGISIHNRVYEEVIFNYMTSKLRRLLPASVNPYPNKFRLPGNRLDLEKALLDFQSFMREQYSRKDRDFLERHGRLVFLAFIKPIINGGGYDFKEPQISEERRLDVIITYFQNKYVVELKIWRGQAAHEEGLTQLSTYLDRQGLTEGYLVIFDHAAVKSWKNDWIFVQGKKIFAVWV